MIDPLIALAAPVVYSVWRLAAAHAEATVLRARAEVVRAGAGLPPGTEISGNGKDDARWRISIPAGDLPGTGDDR
ncbi:hypothetical protein [Paractinoplanes atraurantiacus]|uniref:TadE-like protein n=1 Tax=Paractinoplanes atraurantiacus TaxID=1036182 RepID=A0A285K4B8_9ACTN|nr:hypothetical protein [Actinoplanes atraurantiacus]SNY67398.1 hypothetical protein SAMN05421748_131103 [Actinoplanes atraurantiacus]